MAKYRLRPNDIVAAHAGVERRLSKLERNPRAQNTGVNRGSLVFDGGVLTVNDASSSSSTSVPVLSANGSVASGIPNSVSVNRNTTGPLGNSRVIDFFDSAFNAPTFSIFDKQDSVVLSDASHPAAFGMGDPRIHVQFFDPNTSRAFTSSSYTNFRSAFWYMYHPHLRVTVLVAVDAATTGRVRVREHAVQVLDEAQLTAGMNQYVDLICDRRNTVNGALSNGDIANLDLEVVRDSGAGNVNVIFVEAIGIDLSFLWS